MEGRRLPSWMLAPPGKGETCKSKSSSATVSRCKDNAVSTQEKEAEAKELTVNLLPGNEGERKRGKRKLLERGCSDAITKERKKAGDTAAPSKTTITRRRKQSRRRPPSPSHDDDDDDDDEIVCNSDVGNEEYVELTLTEEDLLSIANEYIAAAVAANEDSKIVVGEAEKKKQVGGTDSSSEIPPTKEEEAAAAAAALERSIDEEKKASTAAAGEDMLNILLGNLLTKNVLEDVSNNEYMKKEQLKVSQSTTTATVTNDAALPMTSFANKKKSSLKDKVTMFLS